MPLLHWIGRQKTRAIAALVFIALCTPFLGQHLRPFLTPAVFCLLIIAFLRMDTSACLSYFCRPTLVIATTLWTTLAIPILCILGAKLSGIDTVLPDIFTGLMLQVVASPMMAAPAIAAILGLDATLILVTLVCSTALVPLSAPAFAALLSLDLSLSPARLGLKLFLMLAGSAILGLSLRRIVGQKRLASRAAEIDGINILILFVFASAIMSDAGGYFLQNPSFMLTLTALTFLVSALLLGLTYFAFLWIGTKRALAVGIMTSQRNMGLMLAGVGGAVPEITWLYFAAAQFPIHLAPWIIQSFAQNNAIPK